MNQSAVTFIFTLVAFTVGYFTMIHGWGLEPKSMTWIIGSYAVFLVPSFCLMLVNPKD